MTLRLLALVAFAAVSACGADGPPEQPAASTSASGLTISGCAEVGVVIGPKGNGRTRC